MLTRFRQHLGRIKEKLERRVERINGGSSKRDQRPITEDEREFMLGWILGKATDEEVIERAKAGSGLALIERACASRPANALFCAVRAQYLLDEGELEEARFHAERGYVLGRLEPLTGLALVRVLAASGKPEDALKIVPAALDHARRLQAHAIRLDLCEEWRRLEPESIEPPLEVARTLMASGELDQAIESLKALAGRFGQRADILLPLAAIYQDQVRPEDAMATYLQAVEAEPGNVDALCMAGACARDLADTAQAERLLEKAHELDPSSAFAKYNLGLLRADQGRLEEASALILGARDSTRGEPWTAETLGAKLEAPVERTLTDVEWASARFKLVHDIEQFDYLRARGRLDAAFDPVIEQYRVVLHDPLLPADAYSMVALDPQKYPLLARTYKAPVHAPDPEPPQGPLVNPDLDWRSIEDGYLGSKPNLTHIDDLLTPQGLAAMREYALESTFWNELKGGYLGAYMPDGFAGRLVLRIASELRERMPRVIRDHPLQTMWAYKYDSRYRGIGVHADVAAVNVNFWITPDEANLDPETGGLVVYTHDAPRDWSFHGLNADAERIYRYLESNGAKKVKVPYRANRAVIFDSDLFHETDAFQFREGYENRRINVTMLFGTRAG